MSEEWEPKEGDHLSCPFCNHFKRVSLEDSDATFGDMLGHIRYTHPSVDMSPPVLWPKVKVVQCTCIGLAHREDCPEWVLPI